MNSFLSVIVTQLQEFWHKEFMLKWFISFLGQSEGSYQSIAKIIHYLYTTQAQVILDFIKRGFASLLVEGKFREFLETILVKRTDIEM